ncbi:hypothetical protein SNOG_01587 [Parastagonospora nodorum SN15]|uniref:Uncharacterized protein n=1 Tax=Phaeosphaeria nodorum (strain SN15 / ATCC MYA-4574 / FGSC 10173) TaxID=321614 RepID=Q0V327_PHANO|nr:hypothetical protein SNOG_01587 [Parastagonospora nodorum SN15]EAT91236.1 hypothetical protein SNOG_01587 [Parastagonospora nodorum SN15]
MRRIQVPQRDSAKLPGAVGPQSDCVARLLGTEQMPASDRETERTMTITTSWERRQRELVLADLSHE